jgi:hypothetical protein
VGISPDFREPDEASKLRLPGCDNEHRALGGCHDIARGSLQPLAIEANGWPSIDLVSAERRIVRRTRSIP